MDYVLAQNFISNEAGGHRWQRIPPTEKKGRVHTSTVTVACMQNSDRDFIPDLSQVEVITTKDSGPGGQHRNKTESCVIMRDKNTGISVKAAKKSQHQNRKAAKQTLIERITERHLANEIANEAELRKTQVGSGMRGDKIRTYRVKDNQVVNHLSDRDCNLKNVLKGKITNLWS